MRSPYSTARLRASREAIYRERPAGASKKACEQRAGFARERSFRLKPCKMGMRRPVVVHGSNPPKARMTDAAAPVTPPASKPVERRDRNGCRRQALAQTVPGRPADPVRARARGPGDGRAQAHARASVGSGAHAHRLCRRQSRSRGSARYAKARDRRLFNGRCSR